MKKIISMIACILLILASFTGCGTASNSVTFLMADVQEGEHPSALACDKFAEMVNSKTHGRVNIEVYHGDSLGSEGEQLKQITVGGLDFACISCGQLSNYEDNFKAFQALYLYKQESDMWDILKGEAGDSFLHSESLAHNNIQGLSWFSGGSRNFYNNEKEIHSPSDLSGLKLRVNTESMIRLLDKNGAQGIDIAYNDIYANVEDGKIMGAENNWASYISTKHYKLCKYITIDEHNCLPELIVASKSAMESISEKDQKIIQECADEVSEYQIEEMQNYQEEAIKKAEKSGVTVTKLTDAEKEEFQKQGEEINAELFSQYNSVIEQITKK